MCRCWVVDGETCRKKETKMGKRLYVGNLSYSTTEADLRDAFVASGHEVAEVKLVLDRDTGRPRGFAFVEMSTDEGAQAAIESLNGKDLQGRTIAVSEARERTGGGGRGGFHGGDRGGFQGGDRGGRRQRW
jgi:cold-inducible RNA-binding protein